MQNRLVLVAIAAVLFAVPREAISAASQPFSGLSKGPLQADAPSANPQKDQAVSPYTKQPTQAPPQQAAPAQKFSPAGPLTKQPTQPAAAITQQKIEEAKLVSVQPGPAQWISWGYLRAYQPETLGRMLGDVNTGRLPRTAVAGVVPAAQLDTLLKNTGQPAGNAAVTQSLPSGAVTQKSSTQSGGVALKPNIAGTVKTAPSTGVEFMPALKKLPFRTTPDRLEFGTLMLGQVQYKTVRFMAPLNGEARVSISDPAFRIRRLRSLTGTFSLQTVPVTLAGGATIQSVNAVANASQQRTAPPWTIPIKVGEDVEITIDVSRSPSVPLGEHAAQLHIDIANSPGALVPVHARLDGRLYGIGINVDGAFAVLPGRDFLLPFEWINDGEPGEATITLDNPPQGFTTPSPVQSIKLGKGERRQGAFVINVSNILQKPDYGFATLNLKVANGPIRLTYGIDLTLYPLWLMRSVVGRSRFDDGDEVTVYGMMQIRNDGWFQFNGKITSSAFNGIVGGVVATKVYRYDVGMTLPGGFNHTVHGSFGKGSFGSTGSGQSEWSESGMNMQLANNYLAAASGLSRAAMNPYIKVTKSAF